MNTQTNFGVIADPSSEADKSLYYIAGAESPIKYEERITDGNWSAYLPVAVPQSIPGVFDTNACTHFSANQVFESQVKYLWKTGKLSQEAITFLTQYCTDGTVDTFITSKRFNAITGKNTPSGNYFKAALETIRKDGLIPDTMFSFGGNNWYEYHNGSLITEEMRTVGKKFLSFFDVQYDVIYGYDQIIGFNQNEMSNSIKYIKQAPLHIGIPVVTSHAIMMTRFDGTYDSFDHYPPFYRTPDTRSVGLAYRGVLTIKEAPKPPVKPVHFFKESMQFGSKGDEVKALQQCLIYLGYLKQGLDTGFFGHITENAVKKLQNDNYGTILKPAGLLKGTGLVRTRTMNYLNSLFQK